MPYGQRSVKRSNVEMQDSVTMPNSLVIIVADNPSNNTKSHTLSLFSPVGDIICHPLRRSSSTSVLSSINILYQRKDCAPVDMDSSPKSFCSFA